MSNGVAAELRLRLDELHAVHQQEISSGLAMLLDAVRVSRAARMRNTYADLRAVARYRAATDFLIDDLFGAGNLGARVHQLKAAEAAMLKTMPTALLRMLVEAIHLTTMIVETDITLSGHLRAQGVVAGDLSDVMLAEACLQSIGLDRYKLQIKSVQVLGNEIDAVINKPLVGTALRMCRKPAHLMGLGELQDFLERGFGAFKKMHGAGEFLATFDEREKAIYERIYS
jgi:hypothetical protein